MAWAVWIGAALVLGLLEIFTIDLFFLTLSLAALVAGVSALLGFGVGVQIGVFAAASLLLLWLVRPWARDLLARSTPDIDTGARGLVGMDAVVTAPLTGPGGRVRLQGGDWSAKGEDNRTFPVGSTVKVVRIEGATAVVGPKDTEVSPPGSSIPKEPLY